MKNNPVYRFFSSIRDCLQWAERGYAASSPHFIKQGCLLRNGFTSATWVETGTFLGQSTQLLARNSTKVYSIEPGSKLFARAQKLFRSQKHLEILHGSSEDVFPVQHQPQYRQLRQDLCAGRRHPLLQPAFARVFHLSFAGHSGGLGHRAQVELAHRA